MSTLNREMKQRGRRLIIAISTLAVGLSCCGIAAFYFGMLPPSEILARRYLDAVIREDSRCATALAGPGQGCRNMLEEDVTKDIAQFGTADTRNVIITVYAGTGVDEGVQVAVVNFEYRRSVSSEWQPGEMRLLSHSNMPGLRYLCGNLRYHGP